MTLNVIIGVRAADAAAVEVSSVTVTIGTRGHVQLGPDVALVGTREVLVALFEAALKGAAALPVTEEVPA